ncbi:membrane protein, inferred for ABFAE pathway [Hyalangium minutum]|uniref:Membrane protein, inferred for ABFAE pathway n=1 Tax=Hyalangium minutum TaxID=394096 RepID=A0A085WUG5_9BACT|nr:membrane protein, inferred for ABFAE pathway [Hyalangium minutum]
MPWLIRHRHGVLAAAALLGLLGTCFSVLLYRDLRSEVEELLPSDAPSVVAAKRWGSKLHDVTLLSVVLEGQDPHALQRFAEALAARLKMLPRDELEAVEYRTDADVAFLKRFGLFYVDTEDLRTVLEQLQNRVAWERRHANPLLVDLLGTDQEPPPLDFSSLEQKYGAQWDAASHFRDGYYQTPEGHLLALLLRPPELATGYASNKKLLDRVRQEVQALDPPSFDPTMRVGYDGEVASLVEEQEALQEDLVSSTVMVLVCVLAALWLFFRHWPTIMAIVSSLAVGCAVTFGASYFLVGHLNTNTAFLGSIVVGNGINAAIIISARYLEERRAGGDVEQSLQRAWRGTLAATFVASFAAGLAYLSLAATAFRGFNQFGVIGSVGMAACWVSAALLLPPLLFTMEAWRPADVSESPRAPLSRWVSHVVVRRRGLLQGLSLVLLGLSGAAVLNYRGELIEYNITRLRSRQSLLHGSLYWGQRIDEIFRVYLTPVVIIGETPADLDKVVAALEKRRATLGAKDPLREVRTLKTVLPSGQEEKLPLIQELRAELTDARLEQLPAQQRQKVEQLRPPEDVRPVTLRDLPRAILWALTERDGTEGRVALAFPRKVGTLDSKSLHEITQLVRGAIQESGARAEAVSESLLFADIAAAITRDGPRATGLALGAVTLLVILVFRRVKPTLLVLFGLLLGVAWLVGLAAAAQTRVNFLNFVVLPITFGIGVDYAVNIVQRWQLEGPGSLPRILRGTGRAVVLCSCTTMMGYASLLAADNQALAGFGLLASLGELTCISAALFALPAWMLSWERHQSPAP